MTVNPQFNERHYRAQELAQMWGLGRTAIRLLLKDQPGVIKSKLGTKQARATYIVPESVAKRIYNQMLAGQVEVKLEGAKRSPGTVRPRSAASQQKPA